MQTVSRRKCRRPWTGRCSPKLDGARTATSRQADHLMARLHSLCLAGLHVVVRRHAACDAQGACHELLRLLPSPAACAAVRQAALPWCMPCFTVTAVFRAVMFAMQLHRPAACCAAHTRTWAHCTSACCFHDNIAVETPSKSIGCIDANYMNACLCTANCADSAQQMLLACCSRGLPDTADMIAARQHFPGDLVSARPARHASVGRADLAVYRFSQWLHSTACSDSTRCRGTKRTASDKRCLQAVCKIAWLRQVRA